MAIMRLLAITATVAIILSADSARAQTRDVEVSAPPRVVSAAIREALQDKAADFWIYEDLPAGVEELRRTGKPILLSIR